MASLAPVRPPSATSNRSPTPSSQQHNNVFRHQHSLSSSTPSNQHFGALSPRYGPPRSAGGMRQSLDNTKQSIANPPLSPRLPPGSAGHNIRPNSEMLGLSAQQQLHGAPSLEAEAIDKWFEDLQSYEATLEEMATASLDASFKEELSAIEQWFRVLSEAERTAALYSLLQSSTQVQIRFFITVLQQMARSDPMTALLSPAPTGNGVSMKQQMEAKLAQLSKMSPASPIVRQFARQSLGPNTSSNEPYLSPNSALLSDSNNFNTSPNDAAALLASQRAKLQSKAANRVSAPGQLLGDSSLKSPKWSNFSGPVEEEAQSRSVSPRPKSTSSELNPTSSNQHNPPAPTLSRTLPSPGSGQESQMSPAVGGSWASQVNTPLVPMFANKDSAHNHYETHQAHGEAVANRLAQWGATHQAGSNSASLPASALAPSKARGSVDGPPSGIQLDDARKFRRASKSNATNASSGFSGVLSGMNSSTNSTSSSAQAPNRSGTNNPANGQSGMLSRTMPATNNTSNAHLTSAMSSSSGPSLPGLMSAQSLLGAPQTAMAAAQQNWRNGLNSPNTQSLNSPDPTMVNNLAMMNTLAGLNGGMDMNSMANLAAMANMTDPNALQNMANILNMRQQIQQVQSIQALQQQLQQNGMIAGMMNAAPLLSPANNGRFGMNMGFPINGGAGAGMAGNKRSPGIGARPAAAANKPNHTPGSGANPEEELDMKLLGDVSAWLRGLRLHKYTPNFEGCTWKEMVMMSDSDLENRGVAAVGARRKMLRTFETVRLKTGMALPGDGDGARDANGDRIESAAGNVDKVEDEDRPTAQHQQPTSNVSVTPESDQ